MSLPSWLLGLMRPIIGADRLVRRAGSWCGWLCCQGSPGPGAGQQVGQGWVRRRLATELQGVLGLMLALWWGAKSWGGWLQGSESQS